MAKFMVRDDKCVGDRKLVSVPAGYLTTTTTVCQNKKLQIAFSRGKQMERYWGLSTDYQGLEWKGCTVDLALGLMII